jgi:carbamoyltransferase
MLVLGVASLDQDSAVALLDDKSILTAIEEEKLSRGHGINPVPATALHRVLDQHNIAPDDLDSAALADSAQEARFRESGLGTKFSASRKKRASARGSRKSWKSWSIPQLRGVLSDHVKVKLQQYEHHLCHAASTYCTSGFDRALILTLDGGGAARCGQVSLGEGDEIRPLRTMQFPDSLGWFYSRITALLGMIPGYDEHKVQWIGREGQPEFLPVFRKLFRSDAHGLPVLDRRYFAAGIDERGAFSPQFFREMKLNKEKIRADAGIRAAIARSAQLFLEESVLEIAHHYQAQTGADSLCVAGGVFLNVLLVRALEKRSTFNNVYVQPVAGNAGTALGAAFLARKKLTGKSGRAPLKTLALGPALGSQDIKAVLDNCKIIYKYTSGEDHLISECVKILAGDKIVAWCQGRTEFGHRALGNRSILASPFSEYVIDNVNQYIKHRADFHPFALSVPAERAHEFFDASPNCRFMASLAKLKSNIEGLEQFAFNNREVRVHTVEKDCNPSFWRLLHKFGESAPAPILVNTSFNLFGEPLVSDPREAVRSFYCSGIDALALGSFLVVK